MVPYRTIDLKLASLQIFRILQIAIMASAFSQYNAHKLYRITKRGEFVETRLTLPDEVLDVMAVQSSPILNLSKLSKRFHLFFFDVRPLGLNLLRRLLSHGALGELEAAEIIWRGCPDLLTWRGTIYHPNRIYIDDNDNPLKEPIDISFDQNPGRYKYVDRTFWQILIMNEEYEEAEEVGKLMSDEEKRKQFAEIFPHGEIKKYNFDLKEAKRLLQVVFDEVAKDQLIDGNDLSKMSKSTREAMLALYAYAKPKSEHDTGLVFDANFYIEALKLYDEKSDQFKKWDRYKFWCIKVEEWLAGCLGTGYLRPHAQGIGNELSRSGCILANGSSCFAFRRSSHSIRIGFYIGREEDTLTFLLAGRFVLARRSLVTKLMSSKNENRDRLYAAICQIQRQI